MPLPENFKCAHKKKYTSLPSQVEALKERRKERERSGLLTQINILRQKIDEVNNSIPVNYEVDTTDKEKRLKLGKEIKEDKKRVAVLELDLIEQRSNNDYLSAQLDPLQNELKKVNRIVLQIRPEIQLKLTQLTQKLQVYSNLNQYLEQILGLAEKINTNEVLKEFNEAQTETLKDLYRIRDLNDRIRDLKNKTSERSSAKLKKVSSSDVATPVKTSQTTIIRLTAVVNNLVEEAKDLREENNQLLFELVEMKI